MTPILQAIHPILPARDLRESIRFYRQLGFTLQFLDSASDPKYAAVSRDAIGIHLQWNDAGQWAFPIDRPAFRFLTSDVDALFDDFRRDGVLAAITGDPGPWNRPADTPWGTREFHLRDPAGNSLQFYQPR